jgi:hypothetical protein
LFLLSGARLVRFFRGKGMDMGRVEDLSTRGIEDSYVTLRKATSSLVEARASVSYLWYLALGLPESYCSSCI